MDVTQIGRCICAYKVQVVRIKCRCAKKDQVVRRKTRFARTKTRFVRITKSRFEQTCEHVCVHTWGAELGFGHLW